MGGILKVFFPTARLAGDMSMMLVGFGSGVWVACARGGEEEEEEEEEVVVVITWNSAIHP